MTITTKIIEDSINNDGIRLTTYVLRYPRYLHAELMTHRVFSRNASSSRAIPVEKMIAWCLEDPAIPVEWGKNQKGMQADEVLSPEACSEAEKIWLEARDDAVKHTKRLIELGVHKQYANRILEPWHHIAVVLSSTQYANWFALRDHKMALPDIQVLAARMADDYVSSKPKKLWPDDWHLPFVSEEERKLYLPSVLIKASVARCARVSYMNHDGTKPDMNKDIALHDMLVVAKPLHASPAEHQATPLRAEEYNYKNRLSGNFIEGWKQYRKTLQAECVHDLPAHIADRITIPDAKK